MSRIGIDIDVKTGKLSDAKKNILDTARALQEVEKHGSIDLSVNDGEFADIARDMMETMRKLETMNSKISATGGKKTTNQDQEASRLILKQKADAEAYEKALAKVGTRLDELYEKKRKLQTTQFVPGSKEYDVAQQKLDSIEQELSTRTASYEKLQGKYDNKIGQAAGRSGRAGEEIAGYQTLPDTPPGGSSGLGIKKMLGFGAGILGGFSIMQFLHDSMTQSANYSGNEADLTMRGAKPGFRNNAALMGYDPMESIAIQENIGKKTDHQGQGLNDISLSAAYYGRKMGIGGEAVSSYVGGSFASTGASVEATNKQLKYLHDTAIALGARGRIEEVLRSNQSIMAGIVQGRGGKELTDTERMGTLAMQMGLWSGQGQIGKGSSGANIVGTMDQNIRSGGSSPGTQIMLSQALGIEKVTSLKELWDYQKRKLEGASPRNVKAIIDYSEKISKQQGYGKEETELIAKMNVRDAFGLNENQTDKVMSPEFRASLEGESNLKDMVKTPEGRKRLQEAGIDPMSLMGNTHRRTIAGMSNVKIDAGNKLLPYVDKFKDAMMMSLGDLEKGNVTDAFMDAIKNNPLGQLMVAGAGVGLASKVLPAGLGFGAGAAAAGTGAAVAGGASTLGLAAAGLGTAAYIMAPKNDQVGEDAIAAKMKNGSFSEIRDEAQKQASANNHEGGLIAAIWALVDSFRVWMYEQQTGVRKQDTPDPGPRFRKEGNW